MASAPGHISSMQPAPAQHGTYSFRASEVGGYDVDFVDRLNPDYECPICQFTFRDPVQTRDCGHRFCESCLEPILRKQPAVCPIDRRSLSRDKFKKKVSTKKSAPKTSEFYINQDDTVKTTKYTAAASNSKAHNGHNGHAVNIEPSYIDRVGGNINFTTAPRFDSVSSSSTKANGITNLNSRSKREPSYIDRIGGNINFATAPRIDNFSPTRRESSEVTIFWTQPRQGRLTSRNRDNPVFVDEPVDFYEQEHLDHEENYPDIHEPLLDKRNRKSWAPISGSVALSDIPRSKSLNQVYPFDYDYDRINLAELKKRRQEKRHEDMQPEANHIDTLTNVFVDPRHTRVVDQNNNYDSGFRDDHHEIHNHSPIGNDINTQEEEPIEVLLTRKLKESQELEEEGSSSTKLRSRYHKKRSTEVFDDFNDDSNEKAHNVSSFGSQPLISPTSFDTFLPLASQPPPERSQSTYSRLHLSDVAASKQVTSVNLPRYSSSQEVNTDRPYSADHTDHGTFKTVSVLYSDEESIQASKESLSYWASAESFGNDHDELNLTRTQIEHRKNIGRSVDNVFTPDQTRGIVETAEENMEVQPFETVDWSHVQLYTETDATTTEPSTELLTSDGTLQSASETEAPNISVHADSVSEEPEQSREKKNLPYGKFVYPHTKSPSSTIINEVTSTKQENKASVVRLHADDLFFKMEKTLSDLQIQLDNVLETDPQDGLRSPFSKNHNEYFRGRGSSEASYFKHLAKSPINRSSSLITLPTSGSNIVPASSANNDFSVSNYSTRARSNSATQERHLNHDPTLTPLVNAITNIESNSLASRSEHRDVSNEPIISASAVQEVLNQPSELPSLNNVMAQRKSSNEVSKSSSKKYFPVSNVDMNVNVDDPSLPSSVMLTIDDDEDDEDDEDVSSYLNVEGPVNVRTSSGVTLLRRESSVYRVPKKKKIEYVDVLMDGNGNETENVYPDRACKRTIMSLMVRCYNFDNDCEWTGELANLQEHIEQCQLIPVACVNACGRTDIPRNQENGTSQDVDVKNQMNQHVDADGDCPLAVVSCRYSDVGCKFKEKGTSQDVDVKYQCRRLDMALHQQESMEQHLDMAHTRIRELEVRQENICMNGKFLWKIGNYEHLMKQSATKKDKEKLCSPPFYTGQYGYKLRAEAFLNGLGQGKGSHLSLYVVIMKGEYDAILPWPFKQNVDFYLMDQDDDIANRQNKVWKLSCERNSDYFQRPTKSKSLGFGCPKFVSLDTLKTRNYIKDQTLFIKIVVEPTDGLIFNAQAGVH